MKLNRAPYSAIIDRPPFRLPGGAKVAVWVIINLELWDMQSAMPRVLVPPPGGGSLIPDIPNFSWNDYGLRVGFWRLKAILDQYGIKATLSLNGNCCNTHPRIVEACLEREWEMLAHGFVQRVLNVEDDERKVIRDTLDLIKQFSGKPSRGWMGPGINETWDTLDILAEEGVEYCADWVNDDGPYRLNVKSGSLVSIPYTLELNDIPIHLIQCQGSSGLHDRTLAEFETLYEEGSERAKIMTISMHPYVSGVAHRAGYFKKILDFLAKQEGVVFMTGAEIFDWYAQRESGEASSVTSQR